MPGECRLSLIRKLRPGESLDEARAALEEAIRAAPVDPGIASQSTIPPAAIIRSAARRRRSMTLPLVRRLTGVQQRPGRTGAHAGAPFWSEAPFLATARRADRLLRARRHPQSATRSRSAFEIEEYRRGILAFAAFLAGAE